VRFEWIPREINTRADKLANLAMDLKSDTIR
jgi:ribonuclease HI